ncbi:MAG: SDR family oxidoreductase [Burkholderiales bacterium]|nr:SDR family oxidoreductase [Burkholderiales bacterium]
MDLKDKIVVITGGTKGLGKALAFSFVKNYSKVVVCSREDNRPESLEENILWIKADVTKEDEMKELADKVVEKFEKIDIWINNAGLWLPRDFIENLDMGKVREMFDVNVFGLMNGTKIAIMHMKQIGNGMIINLISDAALMKKPHISSSAYLSSKYAVNGFTSAIRAENENIKVFSIFPGAIKTEIFGETKFENYDEFMEPSFVAEKIVDNLKKEIPEEELIIRR